MTTAQIAEEKDVVGKEHWTDKKGLKLFLWEKYVGSPDGKPVALFVHGSSMASQPCFDLHVDGRPFSSAMNWFATRGYDIWSVDMEGYGRSDKSRDITCDVANGVDDVAAAVTYIQELRGPKPLLMYGSSSGAIRAAAYAEKYPDKVSRIALDAFVWTGEGSPTLEQRRKRVPEFQKSNRRPIDHDFIRSVFTRDHVETTDGKVIEAFAEATCSLDTSVPTGTYLDMCLRLPLNDPTKLKAATLIMRGQFDGIAGIEDLLAYFAKLPNPDKQFSVMTGISHASFQQKNYLMVYDILETFFSRPTPEYVSGH
jgi:pimeloyl-ACP methyl ester carboxylesterase